MYSNIHAWICELLVMQFMVYSMAEDDLFCTIEMDHTLLPNYSSKILRSIYYLECFSTPQTLPFIFIKPQNVIIVPNIWNKIKLCLCFCTYIFIIKQRMIFWQRFDLRMMTWCKLYDVNLRKLQLVKNERVLAVTLAINK